ncbi:hypothetical protein QBC33DRAFT_598654 [Phialemonium atrogriseum]|uniref:FAD-binding domain-containing protein n=1 Tax=Phialemonium atrogriseum TaxID=1093897 RepID=A0AAJ0FH99_9PEZI|nr:uncharacterized protein QBC33DRAFT_598654 [Phialemonium atrogriseum]KAK1763183.1 hypothetical protein QBC33DRAFT_598654 [Phialemonium atrogriseum]
MPGLQKVIIIGSGPAGLAAALRLKVKNGVEAVVVYEVRDAPTSLGGAVMVPCNGLRLLDRLGLYDELARRTALKELAIQPLDPPLTATFLPDGLFVAVDCTAAQDLLFWRNPRVLLISDTAHAAQPHSGQGVSGAPEDVFLLSRLLESGPQSESATDQLLLLETVDYALRRHP